MTVLPAAGVLSAALLALAVHSAGQEPQAQAARAQATQAKKAPAPLLSFTPFSQGLPTSGEWREGFRVADMNGDGHLDIVHGPPRKRPGSPPIIFLGDGKGAWKVWREAQFPPLPYDYGDVEVADFNGDGHPDLALAVHLHGLLLLTGDGHGVFTRAGEGLDFDPKGAEGFSSRALRAIDWNGDGLPDLVALWEGPRFGTPPRKTIPNGTTIFLNQGATSLNQGGWRKSETVLSPGNFSDSLALGDFNGDGHLDIASGSSVFGRSDVVNLWRADGATPVNLDLQGPNHFVQAVGTGDFDNDGRDDLAVAYLRIDGEVWHSEIDVFYARANGSWERKPLFSQVSKDVAVALASGHLRDKRTRDLVAITMQGETLVYLGDGHGGFVEDTGAIPVYGGGCRGAHVELADLDGDGRDEIITSFADEPSAASIVNGAPGCTVGGGITAWKAAGK